MHANPRLDKLTRLRDRVAAMETAGTWTVAEPHQHIIMCMNTIDAPGGRCDCHPKPSDTEWWCSKTTCRAEVEDYQANRSDPSMLGYDSGEPPRYWITTDDS